RGPATFTRVLDVSPDRFQLRLFAESAFRQLQEPRTDDAALIPQAGNLLQLESERRALEKLETLPVGLPHPVPDGVVDHFGEMAGSARTEMGPALLGGQGIEDRSYPLNGSVLPAYHQAKPTLSPPDSAARADVDKADPAGAQTFSPAHRVPVMRVAA